MEEPSFYNPVSHIFAARSTKMVESNPESKWRNSVTEIHSSQWKFEWLKIQLIKSHKHVRFLMGCAPLKWNQFMKSRIWNKIGWNPKNVNLLGATNISCFWQLWLRILELGFRRPLINRLWFRQTVSQGQYHSFSVGVRWIRLCRSSPNLKCVNISCPSGSEFMFFYELNQAQMIMHGLWIV